MLAARGAKVTVFEQGRRPGGRAATLRTEFGNFDHGAQYFTVQGHAFERAVAQWLQAGVAKRWSGRIIAVEGASSEDKTASATRYTGAEGMISIAKHLSEGIDVRLDTRIGSVSTDRNAMVVARRNGALTGAGWIRCDGACDAVGAGRAAGGCSWHPGAASAHGRVASLLGWRF